MSLPDYSGLSDDVQALFGSISGSTGVDTPVSDALMQRKREEEHEHRRAEAEAFAAARPGQEIKGHGVFVGIYRPEDRDGRSLGVAFNVVAAPEDLTDDKLTYNITVEYISRLQAWHGYNGSNYRNQNELINALKARTYNGEWIVPPREVLYGRRLGAGKIRSSDNDTDQVQPDNLRAHRDKKGFKGTYQDGAYWSSDMMNLGDMVWNINMGFGGESYDNPRSNLARCRPVRLIPVDKEFAP